MPTESTTVWVQRWLDALPNADSEAGQRARDALIAHSRRRMEVICRRMFFSSLAGTPVDWEDVYQEAALRLWKSLESVKPATVREFFGLASTQVRRVLLDMCRKFSKAPPEFKHQEMQSTFDPGKLMVWVEFHEKVASLPENMRSVFDLHWYQGLSQVEVAEILGIDASTVKRRWRKLREILQSYSPGERLI